MIYFNLSLKCKNRQCVGTGAGPSVGPGDFKSFQIKLWKHKHGAESHCGRNGIGDGELFSLIFN